MRHVYLLLLIATLGLPVVAAPTAFIGVNVIPMDRDRVLEDQTVIVDGGKIKKIGPSRSTRVPDGATRVEAKGKYLIPGLVDMHTHLMSDDAFPDELAPDELKVFVANGVTTIRLMIGTPEHLVLRAQSARGEIVAPTLWVASPHLTGREQGNNFVVNTPDEAREAVRKAKGAGYDFIKVTTFIKSLVYEAAVDEANKVGIRVVGHADSRFVTVPRAWAAHQQIEHLDGYLEMLIKDGMPPLSVSDLYIYQPRNWDSIDNVDEAKIVDVARKTVASNPFVDPTQSFMKNTFGLARSEESIRAQPDFKFYPVKTQDFYINYLKRTPLNQVSLEKRARWVDIRNKMIKAIYDAGGKIMVGSDTPEFLWLYGFTEHREMKALAEAGMPNYAVLAAATRNAHEYLGSLKRSGTIEEGKDADLVLLDANPIADITNTEKRAGVMLKGKWYEQSELNKWLDDIAPRFHAVELKGDGR